MKNNFDGDIFLKDDLKREILLRIENIEQGYRVIDNIFKCMPIYWKGEASNGIQDIYIEVKGEIDIHLECLDSLKKQLVMDQREEDRINIKRLPKIF